MMRTLFGTRRLLLALPLALFATGGATIGHKAEKPSNVATGPTVEISIDNFTFTPAEVTVAPGTTIHWVNHDDIPHAVAEKSLAFKSQALDTDEAFSQVLASAGTVDYYCTLHPHMTGRIVVK